MKLELSHRLGGEFFGEKETILHTCRFSPDGTRLLVTGEGSGCAALYDTLSGELACQLENQANALFSQFSADGKQAFFGNRSLSIYDLKTGQLQSKFPNCKHPFTLLEHNTSNQWLLGNSDRLCFYKVSDLKDIVKLKIKKGHMAGSAAWYSDTQIIANVGLEEYDYDGKEWSYKGAFWLGNTDGDFSSTEFRYQDEWWTWAISPDKTKLFARIFRQRDGAIGKARVYSVPKLKSMQTIEPLEIETLCKKVIFLDDNKVLSLEHSKISDQTPEVEVFLRLWDLEQETCEQITLELATLGLISSFEVSSSGLIALNNHNDAVTLARLVEG